MEPVKVIRVPGIQVVEAPGPAQCYPDMLALPASPDLIIHRKTGTAFRWMIQAQMVDGGHVVSWQSDNPRILSGYPGGILRENPPSVARFGQINPVTGLANVFAIRDVALRHPW